MDPKHLLSCLLFAAGLSAQTPSYMQVGDVLHCFGGTTLALVDTAGQTLTPLAVVPPAVNIVKFTWDPQHPDDLIVCGSNNVFYRSTVTAAGVTVTQLPIPTIGMVRQLSWDQTGQLIVVAEAGGNQIFRADPVTGTTTPILSWPLTGVACGRQNPSNGDFYLGTGAGIYKVTGVPTGAPSVTLVAPTPAAVTSLAFDPLQPQFLLFTRSQNVYRLDVNSLLVEDVWTGAQPIESIRTGSSGDFRGIHGRQIFAMANPQLIPPGGVSPVLLGSNTNVGCCALVEAGVVGETYTPFRLAIASLPGCAATFQIDNPPIGTTSTWMFFSGTTTFQQGTGPFLGLVPDAVTLVFMGAFPDAQPGNFVHSLGPPPPTTVIPPGVLCFLSGQTWDVVVAAWGPALQFWGRSNVQRLTWQ